MYGIISKKKYGKELSDEDIRYFVKGYTNGEIPDYQASALMMAICINGMSERETFTLTNEMAHSGEMLDLSVFGDLSADKHSTGGVGDKTSLIVAPIVASCGVIVAKMSGRGLGHTGGTIDKLESIPGMRTSLSGDDFIMQSRKCGIAIVGQNENLAPADKKMYALRDVTATIDSIPLIASSIMSKKLAAGAKNIVLDVKVGSGAFMKNKEDAFALADMMVRIGKQFNRNTHALITDMDKPLGHAVGNSLEVAEAAEVLQGKIKGDLREEAVMLSAHILQCALGMDEKSACEKAEKAIDSGDAFAKMLEWVNAQGGDVSVLEDTSLLKKSAYQYEVKSLSEGYITGMNAEQIGHCAALLGAGRMKKEDTPDLTAGIIIGAKTGEYVRKGDTLCTFYASRSDLFENAGKTYLNSLSFGEEKPSANPLIYGEV